MIPHVTLALRGFSHMAGKFTHNSAMIGLIHQRRPILLENPALTQLAPKGINIARIGVMCVARTFSEPLTPLPDATESAVVSIKSGSLACSSQTSCNCLPCGVDPGGRVNDLTSSKTTTALRPNAGCSRVDPRSTWQPARRSVH